MESIKKFTEYVSSLEGDEKGEAQVFIDRLFQAFGHKGYKEAGAKLEYRLRRANKSTAFADLLWLPRILLEMKRRGEKLQKHFDQMRDYWYEVYPKPRYSMLCNFDEIWIYDFFIQSEPVDKILITELNRRYQALNFLFPDEKKPLFKNDKDFVSRLAANKIARAFNSLIERGEERGAAQRFILQIVFSLFAEDFDLLPKGLFTEILSECKEGASSFDLFGALFNQMNNPKRAKAGRFANVDYFNGGLFSNISPIDLTKDELSLLWDAASEDWSKVQPHIFGSLFEGSMGKSDRHALGAHYTHESDIKKIVRPTIEKYFKEKIENATTLKQLLAIRLEMNEFRVLDPACGCGNFLYVAFMEMRRLEMSLLQKIHDKFKTRARIYAGINPHISPLQFFGIDISPFAVELAKVTLVLAKEQSIREAEDIITKGHFEKEFDFEKALPLENLDKNIIRADALFSDWPKVTAIIGNPPYQSKNKMQQELGADYIKRLRKKYPHVPGRADYCVYWFKRAHDELEDDCRAGLVGTNTIRQNYSREGGLDYIVKNKGTIIEAVSSQPWSGDASVHVSIVNWIKGPFSGNKKLIEEVGVKGKSIIKTYSQKTINSSLSHNTDVSSAKKLTKNASSECCHQGQTHGHAGFLLDREEASRMAEHSKRNTEVIFPYLSADELLRTKPPAPERFSIDFTRYDVLTAATFKRPYIRIEKLVLPARKDAAERELARNAKVISENQNSNVNLHHTNFLKKWWCFSYAREALLLKLKNIRRYIVCARVTKRPIFEFVSSSIHPNDSLQVFTLEDDYSFGILQSKIHWEWFKGRCSTLTERFRYTSDTVFDSFPWPQKARLKNIIKVSETSRNLRNFRNQILLKNNWCLRDLYRSLDNPGRNHLRDHHEALDQAVMDAYGIHKRDDILKYLLQLNIELSEIEFKGGQILGPGLPKTVNNPKRFISDDCVKFDGLKSELN